MQNAKTMNWEQAVLWLRAQPEQQELVRQNYYDDPLPVAAQRYLQSSEWQAIRAELPGLPGAVLEIGAGRGIASYALARDGWRVTALEPNPSDIVGTGAIRALARAENLPIEVVEEWGERLPFAEGTFDLVFCRAVLHHARDLAALGREIGRVLRPGGRAIACREHVAENAKELQAFLAGHPLHRLYGGEHAFRLSEYCAALQGGGLRLTRVLNPLESDINLSPGTRAGLRAAVARRLRLPQALVPNLALRLIGALYRQPGRLYTFIGVKGRG